MVRANVDLTWTVMMEAALGISVFINDRESYDKAMETFLKRVPAYIYLKKSVVPFLPPLSIYVPNHYATSPETAISPRLARRTTSPRHPPSSTSGRANRPFRKTASRKKHAAISPTPGTASHRSRTSRRHHASRAAICTRKTRARGCGMRWASTPSISCRGLCRGVSAVGC